MDASKRSRYLAPAALVAALLATIVVISSGGGSSPSHPTVVRHHVASTTSQTQSSRSAAVPEAFYVVKSGDTLSRIAAATGVSLARLEALNSGVNPAGLQTGQRLRLH